jgi:hypothetical protein
LRPFLHEQVDNYTIQSLQQSVALSSDTDQLATSASQRGQAQPASGGILRQEWPIPESSAPKLLPAFDCCLHQHRHNPEDHASKKTSQNNLWYSSSASDTIVPFCKRCYQSRPAQSQPPLNLPQTTTLQWISPTSCTQNLNLSYGLDLHSMAVSHEGAMADQRICTVAWSTWLLAQ